MASSAKQILLTILDNILFSKLHDLILILLLYTTRTKSELYTYGKHILGRTTSDDRIAIRCC